MGEVLSLPRLSLIAAHNLYEDANGESHFRDIEVESRGFDNISSLTSVDLNQSVAT